MRFSTTPLAIGTGADMAIEASDLTLASGDLRAAADAIRLSRATLRTRIVVIGGSPMREASEDIDEEERRWHPRRNWQRRA